MDEEVINDLFLRAKSKGYLKGIEDFKLLLSNDDEVFNDNFKYVQSKGYKKSIEEFSILVDAKKKGDTTEDLLQPSELSTESGEKFTEQDYFTGAFGDALRGFDSVSPIGVGDFIDDMARAVAGGVNQGIAAENASDLLISGSMATDEDINSYLNAQSEATKYGPSAEMQEYQKTYEDNGEGFLGVVLGLAKSGLTILPELIVSSMSSMASNKDSLAAAAAAIGTGTSYGAATGSFAGGVGAAPGAIAGAAAALPFAFAAAGSALEMGATFSELLQEEAEGKELTADLIKEILNDPEKYTSIRNKAVARGVIIGAIDAYTGKLGGKIASKVLTKGGMQSVKQASKATVLKSIGAAGAIEGIGGSSGEAIARAAIGQEMDISEIALEGLAEIPGGIKDLVSTRFSKSSYKVNGEKVSPEALDELIETMTLEQLQESKINIKNDYQGREKKLQDRVVELSTRAELIEANPELNNTTLDEMVPLQLQLNKLEGNSTQIAKEKAVAIRQKIKDLEGTDKPAKDEVKPIGKKEQLEAEIEQLNKKIKQNPLYKIGMFLNKGTSLKEEKAQPKEELLRLEDNTSEIITESTEQGVKYIGKIEGVPVGTANVQTVENKIIIDDLFIDDNAKRKGVAGNIIDQVIKDNEGKTYDAIEEDSDGNKVEISEPLLIDVGTIVSEEGVSFFESQKQKINEFNDRQKGVISEAPAAEVVVEEGNKPVIVYRGGKPTNGIQYYTDDQKRAGEIAEAKGEPVSEGMNVDITNAWTPEGLDVDNPPQWLTDWVKKEELDISVDDDMVPTERPMSEVMQEIKDVRLSFKDTKLWQSFVTETLKHHDGIIAVDPSEALSEGKKIYITKSPEQIKSIPSKKTKQPGAKKPLEKQTTAKTVTAEQEKKVQEEENAIRETEEYKRVIKEIDGIVEKASQRRTSFAKIPKNVLSYLQGTKLYEDATDVQRESLFREVRKKFGIKEKSAPSVKRILGDIDTSKKITLTDNQLYRKRLKDIQEGAKTAVKSFREASKILAKEVSSMVESGTISLKQSTAILRRFSNVDMLKDSSIERFVDYMTKVINNAEYIDIIANANKKRKVAQKNVSKKIGISDALIPQLQRLFAINPLLIPDSVLNTYTELVNIFGAKETVLTLPDIQEVTKKTEEVLRQIDEELSMVPELSDRLEYSENKVFDDEGNLDYSATLNAMLEEGEITESEREVMKKYKSEILPTKETSEAETETEREELIKDVKESDTLKISELPSRLERNLAGKLERLINSDAINNLSLNDLKNLIKVIDNINNGYLPHFAQIITETLSSIQQADVYSNAIERSKPLVFSKMYSRLKSIVTKRGAIEELIRRNPLFYIDQVFGDYKTKDIFQSILEGPARADDKFKKELKEVQDKLEKAKTAVMKSSKIDYDSNKLLLSSYKQMAYMIQQEYLSNPGSKQVNDVQGFLKATIKRIDKGTTRYTELDAEVLQSILNKFVDDNGNFDNEALFDSFNKEEKKSIETIENINKNSGPLAVYTANIIRGDGIIPLNNYVHLSVMQDGKPGDVSETAKDISNFNKSLKPSTKAKSLVERTGAVSPLNFDVYSSAQRGAKFVLMDFHLTPAIRTSRKTINRAEKILEKDGRIPTEQREVFNAVNTSFEEATENLLTNAFTQNSFVDEVISYISKQGYRTVLAGTGRFIAELTSNLSGAIFIEPEGFMAGVEMRGIIGTPKAPNIMSNLNSTQVSRAFPNQDLSGKLIDTNIINQTTGEAAGKAKGTVMNTLSQVWDKTGQKYVKGVETAADFLISTPDKLVIRPIWFGTFKNTFKNITGNDPNFDKIASNDEAYMNENRAALEEATRIADTKSVMIGATDNAFMGILKGTVKPNQSSALKVFNIFNNYMTRFLIFEYVTARTGIMNLVGKGDMSETQGAALLGGVITRMMIYTLLGQTLAQVMANLFTEDEEDEEELKSPGKMAGQALASTLSSLLLGRDFGNATKSIINLAVEEFNESQLEFLRDGDYDPYKDAIQYTIVPKGNDYKGSSIGDLFKTVGGPFGPIIKTTDLIIRKATEPVRKTGVSRERQEEEIAVRIPLEILGNIGFIPLYKDIRNVVLKNIYKDLQKSQKDLKDNSKLKKEMLQGFDTEGDMKRYDRPLWEKTFGPNSAGYDERQAGKELKKVKSEIKRRLKDDMYDYTPKRKSESTRSSQRSGGESRN
jgi:predicted GNAT family acetyltransferase